MKSVLPPGLIRKLTRESRGGDSPDFLEVLIAEAAARRWFLKMGIPCWRTPQEPSDRGRYSLLFSSGRRAVVVPAGRRRISFDTMAEAKCEYLLSVEMEDSSSGCIKGYFKLSDIRKPGNIAWRPDLEILTLRKMDTFPELRGKAGHFRLKYLLNSIRLLLAGDRDVPPPG